jgi:16S rRNA (guanine527-N7)-methyltransferase
MTGVSDEKISKFNELFMRWNASINLSAARSRVELDEHIRDSFAVVPHLATTQRVVDVGSGGGFPVVLAALALPSVQFTALEPVHKKHAFLRTAARELGLANLDPLALRVEDHATTDYDAAMSRATFDLVEWLRIGLTLVRLDGAVIGFEASPRSGLPTPFERHPYSLDGKTRALILVRRTA